MGTVLWRTVLRLLMWGDSVKVSFCVGDSVKVGLCVGDSVKVGLCVGDSVVEDSVKVAYVGGQC